MTSFEAELLARTRHCQLWTFDQTTSTLPRGPSIGARTGLDSFYAPSDASDYSEDLECWTLATRFSGLTSDRTAPDSTRVANVTSCTCGTASSRSC